MFIYSIIKRKFNYVFHIIYFYYYNYILEPSAVSFYNKLDKTKKIGLDIEPT